MITVCMYLSKNIILLRLLAISSYWFRFHSLQTISPRITVGQQKMYFPYTGACCMNQNFIQKMFLQGAAGKIFAIKPSCMLQGQNFSPRNPPVCCTGKTLTGEILLQGCRAKLWQEKAPCNL